MCCGGIQCEIAVCQLSECHFELVLMPFQCYGVDYSICKREIIGDHHKIKG